MGPIEPGSVQMRISGLGLVPASFDEKTQTVSYQVTQKLRDKTCTVIIAAKSGAKRVEASWSFNVEDAGAPCARRDPGACGSSFSGADEEVGYGRPFADRLRACLRRFGSSAAVAPVPVLFGG